MTKGEMMKLVYTEDELRRIDSAIPKEYWDGKEPSIQVDPAIHVMNYNEPHNWGVLENMEHIAENRGINLGPDFTTWTNRELFDLLIDNGILGDEDKFEDWDCCRLNLIEVVEQCFINNEIAM